MSYHIVKPDFEAHHQEIEVQTQNVEKGRKLKATYKNKYIYLHIYDKKSTNPFI